MHEIKDFFLLHQCLQSDFRSRLGEFLFQRLELLLRLGDIDDHHHIEKAIDDCLRDIEDVDVVFIEESTDLIENPDFVFANDRNDCFFHGKAPISYMIIFGKKRKANFLKKRYNGKKKNKEGLTMGLFGAKYEVVYGHADREFDSYVENSMTLRASDEKDAEEQIRILLHEKYRFYKILSVKKKQIIKGKKEA